MGSRRADYRTLHLMQCSMQFDDSLAQMAADIKYAIAQGPDVIGFTEVDNSMRARWRQEVLANGYHPVTPHDAGTPFAVKTAGPAFTFVKNFGGVKVLDANLPYYGARYITWVVLRWHDQHITVHEGHWARTKWGVDRHKSMSTAMATQVKGHGQGDKISFWMGDLNIDAEGDSRPHAENLNQIFRGNGLLSIFDELHVNPPPTLGGKGVYDVIGCYRPDTQVVGKRYIVHPKQRSDHSFVSAFYDVDVSVATTTGTESTDPGEGVIVEENGYLTPPSGEEGYVDPDFYATGGNISWADYLDSDLYPLHFAYGDSDSTDAIPDRIAGAQPGGATP